MKLSPALRALFSIVLAVLLGATVVSYRNTQPLLAERQWVAHTQEVRATLSGMLSALQDAETGQRGFIITGDERFLEPYERAHREVPARVDRLRALIADNPEQERRLTALQPRIDARLAQLQETLEARLHAGFDDAQRRIREGAGTREMDAVRAGVREMEDAEAILLPERIRAADDAARTAAGTFAVAAILASALIVLLWAVLGRYLRAREEAAREREALLAREQAARHAAEEATAARAASEERARDLARFGQAVMGNMGEGLYTVDTQGRVTFVNAAAERLFGWTSAELLGRPMHQVTHYERPDGTPFPVEECSAFQVLRHGTALTDCEDVFIRKDGTFFPVTYSSAPILSEDTVTGLAVVFRDETERKKTEAERDAMLKATESARAQAEAMNRAKDAFLATVSHELRTPLSPILAWARMLGRGALEPDKARRAVETIERCARAQAQLIEDLLDVSRIVAGKMRLEVRPVQLAPIVAAAADVVRPAADARNVRLQMVLDTETPPVSGDRDRLQQVVWNLLTNAIKFTPKGGRVSVVLERVNSHVEIAVMDTGQGMSADLLPHVFERFRQADGSITRQYSGLGLGLAIVRHIVEAHGGTVHAESPGPGKGSVFTVKLPLLLIARTAGEVERRHPTERSIATDTYPSLAGLRVLVVDDEPDSNEVVRELLATCGAEVRVAASAAQALDVLARWKAELLVTDIGMPGEDGYSLLAKLRARTDRAARIPAIALTAYASVDDRVRLLSAGFAMHVPKPIEPAELLAVVARTAGR